MTGMLRFIPPALVAATAILVLTGAAAVAQSTPAVGTAEDRAALFDYLVEKTHERDALSPYKHPDLGTDVEAAMRQYRDALIAAETEEDLYYAISLISSARQDRHLSVGPAEGGIWPESWGPRPTEGTAEPPAREAPIRFSTDFETSDPQVAFVADLSADIEEYGVAAPEVGDLLVAVNGQPYARYVQAVRPYLRYSTDAGFWWKFAEVISLRSYDLPGSMFGESVSYTLERRDGTRYDLTLPYVDQTTIRWAGHGQPRYPGFTMVSDVQTYDLWVHEDLPVIVLDWYGFREDLVSDMDALLEYAEANDMLDYAVVVDATRSRGGSKGAYAIQRLSPKPFRTTFGNIKLNDVTEAFVTQRRAEYDARMVDDSGVSETMEGGSWQIDWLEQSVMPALQRGDEYSDDVPFKLAHLPPDSDGVLEPTPVHFRGPLVVLLGPAGGSHLDQFVAMVVDNDLGQVIGMPAGGYSNTWEWEETLAFPISGQPLAAYMWSIGHTIRPNGEILEGNPAAVDEWVPLTRDNYEGYRDLLLARALMHLGMKPDVT